MVDTAETTRLPEQALAYHIFRYVPNLLRDEWLNIGVLVFNPETGERRLRLIEDQDEYNRVRRLHPWADEGMLRALRDTLENRLGAGGRQPNAFGFESLDFDPVAVPRHGSGAGLSGGRASIRA